MNFGHAKTRPVYEKPRYVLYHLVKNERIELAKNAETEPLNRIKALFGQEKTYIIVDTKTKQLVGEAETLPLPAKPKPPTVKTQAKHSRLKKKAA